MRASGDVVRAEPPKPIIWRVPMQSIRKTIAALALIATVLAGAALASGWLSVAMAASRWQAI
jgi:hypothetical protein